MTVPLSKITDSRVRNDSKRGNCCGSTFIHPNDASLMGVRTLGVKGLEKYPSSLIRVCNESANGITESGEGNELDCRHIRVNVWTNDEKNQDPYEKTARECDLPQSFHETYESIHLLKTMHRTFCQNRAHMKEYTVTGSESTDKVLHRTRAEDSKQNSHQPSKEAKALSQKIENIMLNGIRLLNEPRPISPSTCVDSQNASLSAPGSFTKTEKLWSKRRLKQRMEMAEKKRKQNVNLDAVTADFIALIVDRLPFTSLLCVSNSHVNGNSDNGDEICCSASTYVDHTSDLKPSGDKAEGDDTETTVFQKFSRNERKLNYKSNEIDLNARNSNYEEETLNSVVLTNSELRDVTRSRLLTSVAFQLDTKNQIKGDIATSRNFRENGCSFGHIQSSHGNDKEGLDRVRDVMNISLEKQNLSSNSKQEINFTTSLPSSQTKSLVKNARQLPHTNEHETEEKKRSPQKQKKISVKGVECLHDEKGYRGKMLGDFDPFSSIGQQHIERPDLFNSRASVTFQQSDDGNMSESISDCVEREKQFDVASTVREKVICTGNEEQLNERIKVGNNSKKKDVFEKSGENSWLEPVANFRSISTKGKATSVSLEDLIRGIEALKCKQMNKITFDGLLSNIDDTVNLLINEGSLPGNEVSGECSDLQQMTLRNKTAELLQNLSTLRARRATMSRLETNIGFQTTSIPCTIPPRPGPSVKIKACESKYGENLDQKRIKAVLHHRMHRSMSNLAQLRARRDEAAFRIMQQRHKLTRMKDYINPSTTHRILHEEKKSSSTVVTDDSCVSPSSLLYNKSKQGPKPEDLAFRLSKRIDVKSRSDEKSNLMSANITSKVDRILAMNSGEGKFIALEQSMVGSSLSFNPKPISACNNSARISNNYSHKNKAKKNLAIIEAPELELPDKRTLPSGNYGRELSRTFFPPPDPYTQPAEQESRDAVPVQTIFDAHEMVSSIPRLNSPLEVSDIYSRDLFNKSVRSSASDGDMQDWEKVGLEKLPLVLKFSKCEEGESRDECEEYGSMTIYNADKNHTSPDAEDTICDGTIGPISDSQHLKHIINMMDESRRK